MELNGLDWTMAAVAVFTVVRGVFRGAISQLFGIAGVLGGFYLGAHHYESVGAQLARSFPKLMMPEGVAFIILLTLTWLLVGLVGFGAGSLLRKTGLGFVDRLWGGIVGLVKALVLAVIIVSALTFFLSPGSPLLTRSYLTPYIEEVARYAVMATPAHVRTAFEKKQNELKDCWLKEKSKLELKSNSVPEKPSKKEARIPL